MRIPELTSPGPSSIRPGSWAAWRIALRPTSLWIATVPVLVATCLAWSLAAAFDPAIALIALAASVLMQVVTNLQNDVGFTERGERNRRPGRHASRHRQRLAHCARGKAGDRRPIASPRWSRSR